MTDTKTRRSASEVYASVASPDGLLYHIAHARKENSAEAYEGAKLKEVSAKRRAQDVARFRETAATFKSRSIPRK
jgi:hypothetical protein